jgi:serine/threonine-protein kinase
MMGDVTNTKSTAFAATVATDPTATVRTPTPSNSLLGLSTRTTVLPRLVRTDAPEPAAVEHRFVPLRVLGRGGLGEVTLVQDNDIDRPVALKRLHLAQASDELVFRFAQEIRTAGQLEHPNIAPVHDVGIDDEGRHFFVMRYVEGETLESIIEKLAAGDSAYHQRYTFERRVQLFIGILHAIEYAHAKSIVHRDIKPANIMVGPHGEVLVMDWGVAKRRGAADVRTTDEGSPDDLYRTRAGSLVGTPAYMSPEQARGDVETIDERSDIYSLCVLFYELLALTHYLPGHTTVPAMLAAIADGDHVNASRTSHPHQTPVPAELGWFVERGLAKDPAQRFQSTGEMLADLYQVLGGHFAVQCPVTFMKRVGGEGVRFADRHPLLCMVGLATLVSLVAFGAFALVRTLL